jgi:glutamate carboxypeptidase
VIPLAQTLAWIDSQRDAMRDRVIEWCNINSYTFNVAGVNRMGNEVAKVLQAMGAEIEWIDVPPAESIDQRGAMTRQPLGKALRARKRPNAPLKVFLGIHLDTVYPLDQPFQFVETIDTNTLRGPGVIDAKGGLVVLLTALAAFEQSNVANQIGWEVLLNPDEEIGSPGSAPLLVESAHRNQFGLVFEPAIGDGNLVDSRKGSGNFTIVVHGKAAHAGRDFNSGRNAIVALAQIVAKLHALNDTLPAIIVNIGNIEGGGAVNVVPDLAIARVNIRTTLPEDESKLREKFNQIINEANQRDGIRATLHGNLSSPPKPLDARSRSLLDQILACARELGLNLSTQPSGGTSDGNKLAAAGLPVIDSLGPRGGKLHSPEEFLHIDSLPERAKLTALILLKFADGSLKIDNWP